MRDKLGQDPVTEKEIFEFVHGFNQSMIVWGSDEVLKQYLIFRSSSQNAGDLNPSAAVGILENLMLAMRIDLGHANKNLERGDLLRLFINDVDDILSH